jgi:hypothetical protein
VSWYEGLDELELPKPPVVPREHKHTIPTRPNPEWTELAPKEMYCTQHHVYWHQDKALAGCGACLYDKDVAALRGASSNVSPDMRPAMPPNAMSVGVPMPAASLVPYAKAWERTHKAASAMTAEQVETLAKYAETLLAPNRKPDPVDHPPHYTAHPSGVECIQITEHMGFNLGNAVKYIWRADLKADAIEDLKKARWYLGRELERRSK